MTSSDLVSPPLPYQFPFPWSNALSNSGILGHLVGTVSLAESLLEKAYSSAIEDPR